MGGRNTPIPPGRYAPAYIVLDLYCMPFIIIIRDAVQMHWARQS